MGKIIAFHANQLGIRGTETAMYNYAHYNETILGNKSIILSSPSADLTTLNKFEKRFEVRLVSLCHSGPDLIRSGVDYCYIIKAGNNDGAYLQEIPSLIHAVFRSKDFHGHKYAYVSDWLCRDQGMDVSTHSVPHIAEKLPPPTFDMREKLGISKNKTVFGCYAGATEFNINFVHEMVVRVAKENPEIVFLFMNINKFTQETLPNIIHLPGSWDLEYKSSFVDACDAMIHARSGGETFGLAVAEFAVKNKPVITYGLSGERNHIEILGERGIYYTNPDEVYDIFNNLKKYIKYDDYYRAYDNYTPEVIMDTFNRVFLS